MFVPRRSPSVEGGSAQRGEPDDWFPGGRGARGMNIAEELGERGIETAFYRGDKKEGEKDPPSPFSQNLGTASFEAVAPLEAATGARISWPSPWGNRRAG